ncbi:MAG: glutaminase [Campylobacterota bacterium]|nr:glutaminase [Campylobacterota bacterium]
MKNTDTDYQSILNQIEKEIQPFFEQGAVAQYIPALSNVDPYQFAMSITLFDGSSYSVGNSKQKFSIQSISKVFSFTQALKIYSSKMFERVGKEPSGDPFNSLVQLEYENGIPRNPFINAGALVVTDALINHHKNKMDAFNGVVDLLKNVAYDENIDYNDEVYQSELNNKYRNQSLCSLMKSFGNIHNDVDDVLCTYFKHCSIEMNTVQLSRAMLFLANHGVDPISKEQFITARQAKRINALMLTCGHYDASGDFAFYVGLPGKSGVGGGIVAMVPGVMSICVYSPQLNSWGNSLIGTKALELFTTKTGLSIF